MSGGKVLRRYSKGFTEARHLRGGSNLVLRPVLPQDENLISEMVRRLSPAARGYLIHGGLREIAQARCKEMSCVDSESHVAVVVTFRYQSEEMVVVEARYAVDGMQMTARPNLRLRWGIAGNAEGLGLLIMDALILSARSSGLQWLYGDVLVRNEPMHQIDATLWVLLFSRS